MEGPGEDLSPDLNKRLFNALRRATIDYGAGDEDWNVASLLWEHRLVDRLGLASFHTRRAYGRALDDFLAWYRAEPPRSVFQSAPAGIPVPPGGQKPGAIDA